MSKKSLSEKSLDFAAKAVKFSVKLRRLTGEDIITDGLTRSAAGAGAIVNSANRCPGKSKEYASEMRLALKKIAESGYWLKLLRKAEYVSKKDETLAELLELCEDLESMLAEAVKG